jgi:hypothetical protein
MTGSVVSATIRPAQAADLGAVAEMDELIYRRGRAAHDELFLRRVFLEGPAVDDEIPSLVATAADGRVVGFIGATVTPMRFGQERVRLITTSHLLTHPRHATPGVGGLLQRAVLSGPQDMTVTDTATPLVARMWHSLGGSTAQLPSVVWLRVVNPWRFLTEQGARLFARWRTQSARRQTLVDARLDRLGRQAPSLQPSSEPLTASLLRSELPAVAGSLTLLPDYSEAHLNWLLAQAAAAPGDSRLVGKLVRSNHRALGWYVYRQRPGHVALLLQLVAHPRSVAQVADHLFRDVRRRGVSAIQGALYPQLVETFGPRPSILRLGTRYLVHSRRPELVDALVSGRAMLSRLDTEWW